MANKRCESPQDVLALCRAEDVECVDFKFVDFPGIWQHFTVPINELSVESFADGFGFDGSSIRGWQSIHESDMLIIPDASTAFIDPFCQVKTISLVANIVDPITRLPYSRDPRFVARKAEEYLKASGLGDTAYFGPEAEFFIFDDVRYGYDQNMSFHSVDSNEANWNTARNESPNLGYKLRNKEGYFPVPPADRQQNLRSEMMMTMIAAGIDVECQHHEVATGGQAEIDIRYNTLVRQADNLLLYKYIVKNTAFKHGKTATFMPKPLFNDNGSGMHTHVSVWKEGKNQMFGNGYAGLSEFGLHFIGGILKHAPAILAFAAPSTNSYKRLVPGFEAPVILTYSKRNRSAAVRIPMYSNAEKAKRVEFRSPDPSCNPYLTFSAILMAGLDGVINKIDPGQPVDENLYELPEAQSKALKLVPSSLEGSLAALAADHEFLMRGNVFTQDVIDTWINYKTEKEIDPVRLRPHPYEFTLYYDI